MNARTFLPYMLTAVLALGSGCDKVGGVDVAPEGAPGTWTMSDCLLCHTSQRSAALDPLVTNDTGTRGKHAMHVTQRGISCLRCHFGYPNNGSHMNGVFDVAAANVVVVAFDSLNANGAWMNDTGPGTGACSSLICHGADTPEWYGTAGWTLPDCAICHSAVIGSRRQVIGSGGDFGANSAQLSHHIIGTVDPTSNQCRGCHDLSSHMSGTITLRNADTGAGIVYSAASPSSAEPFCLSCHDADGATTATTPLSPFGDGVTLGAGLYQASTRISSAWSSSNATHKNRGLTCLGTGQPSTGCHGNNLAANAHGSPQRGLLTNQMNLLISVASQTAYNADPLGSSFNYNNYKLCFDCHDNYPAVTKEVILGYKQGGNYDIAFAPSPYSTATTSIQSLFRDRFIDPGLPFNPANLPPYWNGQDQFYNDTMLSDFAYLPLHNLHLLGFMTTGFGQDNLLVWKYRGNPGQVGRITCTACHNVHGTNGAVRNTHDEFSSDGLGMARSTGVVGDAYTSLTLYDAPGFPIPSILVHPFNCAQDCHNAAGNRSYWHTPANE